LKYPWSAKAVRSWLPIAAPTAEAEDLAREQIFAERLLDQRREPIETLA